jgi:DNA-directed RNA polymerase-3 subunit RPC5
MDKGQLHLHPVTESHQFRPTMTYLDVLSQKGKRSRGGGGGEDNDSDDGPPPDPDEPAPAPVIKKEKKPVAEAKEVQVSARRAADDKGMGGLGGMTAARREMLMAIRAEEDEVWEDLDFFEGEVYCSLVQEETNSYLIHLDCRISGDFRVRVCNLEPATPV